MCRTDQGIAGRTSETGPGGYAGLPDRRTFPRHTVLDHRGWVGQWIDRGFEVADVHLLDLSRGGALFEMDGDPTEHPPTLLGLEALREDWCVEVNVVRITSGRRMKYRVHVAFAEPCHEEFYAAALHGPPTGSAAAS